MLRKNEICIGLGVFFAVLRAKVRCFAVCFFNRKDLFGGEMFVCKRWCDTLSILCLTSILNNHYSLHAMNAEKIIRKDGMRSDAWFCNDFRITTI